MTENNENKDILPVNEEVEREAETEALASGEEIDNNTDEIFQEAEENSSVLQEKKSSSVKESKSNFNLFKEVWEWFYTILIALLVVVVVKGFIFDIVHVSGSSMLPTLVDGDKLFVTKLNYKPEAGDIIILDSNYKDREQYYDEYKDTYGKELDWGSKKKLEYFDNSVDSNLKKHYFVKRIVGLPGDEIDIKDGLVYVNDEVLDETYIDAVTLAEDPFVTFPQIVEEGHVFVLGDNRHRYGSTDSRSSQLGQVPFEAIIGKSQFRIWPFSAFGKTE